MFFFTILINSAFGSYITQTDLVSYRPQIHSVGDELFVVWTEGKTNSEVFFSKSNG